MAEGKRNTFGLDILQRRIYSTGELGQQICILTLSPQALSPRTNTARSMIKRNNASLTQVAMLVSQRAGKIALRESSLPPFITSAWHLVLSLFTITKIWVSLMLLLHTTYTYIQCKLGHTATKRQLKSYFKHSSCSTYLWGGICGSLLLLLNGILLNPKCSYTSESLWGNVYITSEP